MNLSFLSKFFPKNKKTRQNMLVVFLIVLIMSGFVFFYNSYFRKAPTIDVSQPKVISGKQITSQEASNIVIKNIKKDITDIDNELNNDFYSSLRSLQPSQDSTLEAGRNNPFIKQQ